MTCFFWNNLFLNALFPSHTVRALSLPTKLLWEYYYYILRIMWIMGLLIVCHHAEVRLCYWKVGQACPRLYTSQKFQWDERYGFTMQNCIVVGAQLYVFSVLFWNFVFYPAFIVEFDYFVKSWEKYCNCGTIDHKI